MRLTILIVIRMVIVASKVLIISLVFLVVLYHFLNGKVGEEFVDGFHAGLDDLLDVWRSEIVHQLLPILIGKLMGRVRWK